MYPYSFSFHHLMQTKIQILIFESKVYFSSVGAANTALSSVFFLWRSSPSGSRPPHFRSSMITLRHTTHGRTPVDEWSARQRDLYVTTQFHVPGGIRNHNPNRRSTADPHLRPRGHWDRLSSIYTIYPLYTLYTHYIYSVTSSFSYAIYSTK
jgi:hypothetical protein